MNQEIIHTGQDIVPMDLLQRAVISGASVEVMEKLMALEERSGANRARRAFDEAIAAFKAEVPLITKKELVDFTTTKGRTRYRYEDLATIAEAVDKPLSKVGLSYRWRTVSNTPTSVTVTCIVSHRDGYSEENSLSAGPDPTGNKNSIQALGSAVTYLQRYTLKAALGLTASDDDDGQAVGRVLSDDYVGRWEMLLEDATSADDVAIKWNAERLLRRQIEWPDEAVLARLKDTVTRRIEQLKPKPDLATQRLNAEDA